MRISYDWSPMCDDSVAPVYREGYGSIRSRHIAGCVLTCAQAEPCCDMLGGRCVREVCSHARLLLLCPPCQLVTCKQPVLPAVRWGSTPGCALRDSGQDPPLGAGPQCLQGPPGPSSSSASCTCCGGAAALRHAGRAVRARCHRRGREPHTAAPAQYPALYMHMELMHAGQDGCATAHAD